MNMNNEHFKSGKFWLLTLVFKFGKSFRLFHLRTTLALKVLHYFQVQNRLQMFNVHEIRKRMKEGKVHWNGNEPFFCSKDKKKTFQFLLRCLLYTFDSLLLLLSPFISHFLVWKYYHFRCFCNTIESRTKLWQNVSLSLTLSLLFTGCVMWIYLKKQLRRISKSYIYLFYIGNRFRSKGGNVKV